MKKIILLFIVLLFCINNIDAQFSITTSYLSGSFINPAANGVGGNSCITFQVENTNAFPVTLDQITNYLRTTNTNGQYTLWYTPTSLNGAPTVTSPIWTQASGTSAAIPVLTNGFYVVLSSLNFQIPSFTTYRFALQCSNGVTYAGSGPVAPNSFTSNGVELYVGDGLNGGIGNTGYGGSFPSPTNNPRYFDGTLTFLPTFPITPKDPSVFAITPPAGNCPDSFATVFATVKNYGTTNISLSVANPLICSLKVNGPNGLNTYTATMTSGLLFANGVNTLSAIFNNVNMYAGGTYYLNTDTFVTSGYSQSVFVNDSLGVALQILNSRPTPGPNYTLCQNSLIPFGNGLTVSGCTTPILDSMTILFTPFSPATNPTANNVPGAARYAWGLVPSAIPLGSTFLSGTLTATNLLGINGGWGTETRFPLYYGNTPLTSNYPAGNVLFAGAQGSPILSGNYNFTNNITPATLGNIFAALPNAGDTLKMGYHSTWSGNATTYGFMGNTPSTSVYQLKLYYQYVPAAFEWYNVQSGGTSFYSLTPMNPVGLAGSGLANSGTPGTYPFYVACTGSSACRAKTNLVIIPAPSVNQDTLTACESSLSSNSATFDLTTISNNVSNSNPFATVDYFGDPGLFIGLSPYASYLSGNAVIYSKVTQGACYATDSVILQVNPLPSFGANILTGNACAPASIDVDNLISPFAPIPLGSIFSYYNDATYLTTHPNPHAITVADTVYMIVATNTTPACKDTATAYINVIPSTNFIVNQDVSFPPFYFSTPTAGAVCQTKTYVDGLVDTVKSTLDCRKVVQITDVPNTISLGMVTVCQEISSTVLTYNTQPYVNRVYQITPTTNDTASVCLYYLDDDMVQYNAYASANNWPLLPTAANPALVNNIAITKVQNGPVGNIGATATTIPSALISASYNAATQVWTICFPVSGFSHFYLHSKNSYNAPLPVTLVDFNVVRKGQESELSWGTMQEENNSHFIVERSADGKAFMSISTAIYSKAPQGNSNVRLDYNFTDTKPFSGINYYRLRQYDIDGKESISEVKEVYFGTDATVTVYPNPVQDNLIVEVNTDKTSNADIKVFDASGRVVKTISSKLAEGNNKIEIGMSELASGTYLIELVSGKNLKITKVITKK